MIHVSSKPHWHLYKSGEVIHDRHNSHKQMAPEWFQVLFFLLISICTLFLFKQKKGKRGIKLPPSPPKLPFIGNLHQLGKLPHYSLWRLSQKYGGAMLLQLGSIPTLVISSADMAREILKTHDHDCCNRPQSPGPKKLSYNFSDIAFAPYNCSRTNMRKLFVTELLSSKRVKSLWNARKYEIDQLITSVSLASPNTPVNLDEKLTCLVDGIVGAVAFGKSYGGKQFKNQNCLDVIKECVAILNSFSAEDFFPSVGRVVDILTGVQARRNKIFRGLDDYFKTVINEHLDPAWCKSDPEDLVDVLIRLSKEDNTDHPISEESIKAMIMDTFVGGTDSSAITMVWAMSEIVTNPRVLNKVQTEIRRSVGSKPKVGQEDLGKLKYLSMVIKETLRMHPPAPLLIPHESMRHCKIGGDEGYDIYPQTKILVNSWAIQRHPNSWKNPHEFYPERFEENDVDFRGQNFEFIPFGAGRRICPGINLAINTIEFTLANLLYCFDWKPPCGMKVEDICMEEDGSIAIHKKTPLSCAYQI